MRLSDHDLSQLTEEELLELPEAVLRRLSVKLLTDLKEARERLKQNSRNSSRPPSSDPPWDNTAAQEDQELPFQDTPSPVEDTTDTDKRDQPAKKATDPQNSVRPDPDKRKPGKQLGAAGYGRTQKITVTTEVCHYPSICARCDRELSENTATIPTGARAYTAFETVDLVWADPEKPGMSLTNTKHIYYEIDCDGGHCTQQAPHRQISHPLTPEILLSEWRLVGPGLAALIVCLAYRMRLSRPRIQEFLQD